MGEANRSTLPQIEGARLSPQQWRLWEVQQGVFGGAFGAGCALAVEGALEQDLVVVPEADRLARMLEELDTLFDEEAQQLLALETSDRGRRANTPDEDR